jgi:hypothetical protein
VLQPPPQLSQPVLQLLQQDFLWNKPANRPRCFFLQPLLQGSQHVGAGSQQAGSQAGCSQQAGSQAGCSQQVLQGSQQLFFLQWSNRPRKPPNKSQRFLVQQVLQGSQHEVSQAGCSQQVGSQTGSQQVGAGSQQVGAASQQLVSQQLLQPPRWWPNILFSSSKPKLWLHRPRLRTIAGSMRFHFIEQHLLCIELG